jgi:hypothetical protein
VALSLAVGVLAACGGEGGVAAPNDGLVTFTVANDLIAPVTITVNGSAYAIVSSGRSLQLTLPATTRLVWTSAKPADALGNKIDDQVGDITVAVAAINGTLELTNVIENQTYFTARLFNFTNTRVSIGVFDGSKVWCAAVLPEQSPTAPGFVLIGYYKLLPTTEVRAYTTATDCTGAFVPWPGAQLTDLQAKSGLLTLSLEPTS